MGCRVRVFLGRIVCAGAGGRTYPARATCEQTAGSCYHAQDEASRKAVAGRGQSALECNPFRVVLQTPELACANALLADRR
jgi:hypothetical protein